MKRKLMGVSFLPLALLVLSALGGCDKKDNGYNILIHSHNDYDQARPFFGAYEAGADCIEADVWLIDGNLFVSHNRKDVDSSKTIQSMYLAPLKEKMDANGGKAYADGKTLQLMVDLKNDQCTSLGRLVEIIEKEGYKECFDPSVNPSAARLVITNSVPIISEGLEGYPDFVFYDGVPDMDIPDEYYKKIIEVSDCASNVTSWKGEGEMSESDRETILKAVGRYHDLGCTYRLWAFPDGPQAWEMSVQLGLDYINTDHPAEAAAWLAAKRSGK